MPYARRLQDTTRGRVLALLRQEDRTVSELATALSLTDNAVRTHLSALERDGLARLVGERREGVGKPAHVYGLTVEAEERFPKAYATVLTGALAELTTRLGPARTRTVLRAIGRRLARESMNGEADRLALARSVLERLGAVLEVEQSAEGTSIRGYACPLGAVVREKPETCIVVESLIGEIMGSPVKQQCVHGERPRCGFFVEASGSARRRNA